MSHIVHVIIRGPYFMSYETYGDCAQDTKLWILIFIIKDFKYNILYLISTWMSFFSFNFKINSIERQMVKVFSKTSSLAESIIKDTLGSSFFKLLK